MDKQLPAQRIAWVDFAKGIVIILVVLGHTIPLKTDLSKFIFVFHMPFFFIMAGFLLNLDKWGGVKNYKTFVSKLVKRLLMVCYKLEYLRYMWGWTNENPLFAFVEIFIGNANPGAGLILGQLWFLPALFWTEIIFIKLFNYLNKLGADVFVLTIVSCSFLGIFIGKIHALPLGIDIALAAQIFVLVGVLIRKYAVVNRMNLKICVVLMLLLVLSFSLNIRFDMNYRNYGDLFLSYSGAMTGTLIIMKLSILMKNGKIFSLISDCGRQSMMILILHLLFAGIFYEIIAATTNFPPKEFLTNPIIIFGATLFGVLIPLFIAKKFGQLPVLKYFCV